MGTSTSSKGPGSGPDIPIVPPWVDDPVTQPERSRDPIIPSLPRRWQGVRTSLGKFGGGDGDRGRHLRKGLGQYSRSGMGGSSNAARRMAGSARTAGSLYQALDALANGQPLPAEFGIEPGALDGRTQAEIIDILVDAVRPLDGTQDAEASRDSAARALSEAVEENGDVTALTPDQIDHVLAAMLGNDVALRIDLDVGKSIIDKAPTRGAGLDRLQEMKDYVREVVAGRYAAERALHGRLDRPTVERISGDALRQTFEVFEVEGGLG